MPKIVPELKLTTDFESRAWRDLTQYAEARIAELREQNDSPGLTEAQTGVIRGRIAELKALLRQAEPARNVPTRDIYLNHDEKEQKQ
ncbi:MAG: hypothetical protein ACXWG8_00400 [Usitatibacter sp.]